MASQSRALQAGEAYQLFDHLDNFSTLRNGLRRLAEEEGHWAGIPMPLDGRRLTLDPKFPRADKLAELGMTEKRLTEEAQQRERIEAEFGDMVVRNTFWSFQRKADVCVVEEPDGKVRHYVLRGYHAFARILDTLDCSSAWGLEQEHHAVQTLGGMIRHHMFKAYLLTGMFLETSKHSGLTYLFRRLRPTVVIDAKSGPEARIRCALCMHPIGYYRGTWAGVMTPTDDVIAHLALMRGDEPMLWRRANQHPAWRPEAGIY